MNRPSLRAFWTTALLSAALSSVTAAQGTPDPNLTVSRILDPQTFFVPIHTTEFAETSEVWAGGFDYKVSFHDGFRFYARSLGKAPVTELRWRTTAVSVGAFDLFEGAEKPQTLHTDERFEYRFANVHEIYDAGLAGVEQSFRIPKRPGGEKLGDIVIRGAVTTELEALERQPTPGPVVFGPGEGKVRIDYGHAVAIDAAGNRCDVATGWSQGEIELRVPAAWVQKAVFPVVVDPLIRRVATVVASSPERNWVWKVHIARENANGPGSVILAFSRWSRTGGRGFRDAFVYELDENLRHAELLWSDIGEDRNSIMTSVTHVGAANNWLWLLETRESGAPTDQLNYDLVVAPTRRHPVRSFIRRNRALTSTVRRKFRDCSLGGTATDSPGTHGVLVAVRETDAPDGYLDAAVAFPVDAELGTLGPVTVLESNPRPWVSFPRIRGIAVNPVSDGDTEPWVAAWQTDGKVRCARVIPGGGTRGPISEFEGGISLKLAGARGRYLLARLQFGDGVFKLITTRFDLSIERLGSPATNIQHRELFRKRGGIVAPTIAYDANTLSHWCIVYAYAADEGPEPDFVTVVDRLGFTGGNVERERLIDKAPVWWHPQRLCAFDSVNDRFLVLTMGSHTDPDGQRHDSPLAGHLRHETGSGNFPYGRSCNELTIEANFTPYAGHGLYRVKVRGAVAERTAILHMSSRVADVPAPDGCRILVDYAISAGHVATPTRTNATGVAGVHVPLPDSPVLLGSLFFQWEVWGNPISERIWSTGLRAQIRP